MRRLCSISVILLTLYSLAIPADPPSSAPFAWPLKRDIQLSSGFGDGRPGRFHMGIDLRTGGKIGAPVYAPEDGYIRRISMSYFGYGKGLYLAGRSGRTYVFGHLNDFNKAIGSFVERKQLAAQRYYQDIQPDAGALPVKKGELIAHSGQTGAGAPHLHFEIRDGDNRPQNPLLFPGIRLKDTTPPKFKAVWLVYRDDHSLFADGERDIRLKPVTDKAGRTRIADTVLVTGRFAVEAAVTDVVAPGSFAIGPERLTLTIDGRRYHRVEYDRLDYAENRLSLLDRDPDPAKRDYDRVYALYRKPGNTLSNYRSDAPGDGTFADTVEGFHTVAIEAADAFGNTRTLEFTVLYSPMETMIVDPSAARVDNSRMALPLVAAAGRAGFDIVRVYGLRNGAADTLLSAKSAVVGDTLVVNGSFARFREFRLVFRRQGISYPAVYLSRIDAASSASRAEITTRCTIVDDGLLCRAETTGSVAGRLIGEIATDRGTDRVAYRQTAPGRFAAFYRPSEDVRFIDRIVTTSPEAGAADTVVLGFHHLASGRSARIDHDDVVVAGDAGDVFGDALLAVRDTALPPPASGRFVRRPFALLPDWLAFAAPIGLSVPLAGSPDNDKTAFYIHREGNRWSWIGRRTDPEGGRLSATVSGGGAYAVLTDTVPPTIAAVNIADKASLTSGRPQIRCTVADELSGFEDDRNFEITIDGKWIIPEYDADQKLLTGKPHWTIHGTSHRLAITVRDRCGNATTVTRTFHVISKTGPR